MGQVHTAQACLRLGIISASSSLPGAEPATEQLSGAVPQAHSCRKSPDCAPSWVPSCWPRSPTQRVWGQRRVRLTRTGPRGASALGTRRALDVHSFRARRWDTLKYTARGPNGQAQGKAFWKVTFQPSSGMSKKCCRGGQSRALTLTVGSKEATGHVTSRPGMVPRRLKGLEQGSVGVRTCLLGHVWCSAVEEGLL